MGMELSFDEESKEEGGTTGAATKGAPGKGRPRRATTSGNAPRKK